MKRFIGTKLIAAVAMTRAAYNDFRGWTLPANENGADPGYLVEYLDGGKPNVASHAGYVSWSPAEQFEAAYRPCHQMTFGLAIEALKRGHTVARTGWNGKGMFVYLVPANAYPAQTGAAKMHFGDGALVPYNAYLALVGGDGTVSTWVPSVSDTLAEDWAILTVHEAPQVLAEVKPKTDDVASMEGAVLVEHFNDLQRQYLAAGEEIAIRGGMAINNRPAYQQRVVDEHAELSGKIDKLVGFVPTPTFARLAEDEQRRLGHQLDAMRDYAAILAQRIDAFPTA